jgi:hypothetical protein
MKNLLLALTLLTFANLSAQKYMTRSGYVKFYSEAAVENIEAENNQVSSVIDMSKGTFAFVAPIKGFVFEKALMQEHFNENYMESGDYPNGTFKGKIEGFEKVDLSKDGTYDLKMVGNMNIHGVDQSLNQPIKMIVKDGKLMVESVFNLKPADYGIEIPASKKDNIASTLEITVKMNYTKK